MRGRPVVDEGSVVLVVDISHALCMLVQDNIRALHAI